MPGLSSLPKKLSNKTPIGIIKSALIEDGANKGMDEEEWANHVEQVIAQADEDPKVKEGLVRFLSQNWDEKPIPAVPEGHESEIDDTTLWKHVNLWFAKCDK